MKFFLTRLLAICLCICLLPFAGLGEEEQVNDGTPVTRSDFTLDLNLYADGFPNDGAAHYQDWEAFFNKLGFTGTAHVQSFLSPYSRVMVDTDISLNGRSVLPFEYDGYYSYRYLRSPAFRGESVHFQMFNFFQFMLKGYYFMGLPTNLIALPLYPEATVELVERYMTPISETFAGEGSRTVSYDELYELASQLSMIVNEDEYDKTYYYLTCLLIDIGGDYVMLDKLAYMEDWLDYLDPEQQGMTITVEDGVETWVLGETTVFEKTDDQFTFTLPDYEGYVFNLHFEDNGTDLFAHFQVLLEEEIRLELVATMDGLGDPLRAEGTATFELGGEALYVDVLPQTFVYRYERIAETLPYDMSLAVDWLHPDTGLPALGIHYTAAMEELPYTAVYDRPVDNKNDFFHLNESFMAEYKERYMPTLALAAAPFLLEMPAGVISDVVAWMDSTGLLAFFGIE